MRAAVALGPAFVLLALAACHREPDFDERYARAEKSIREKAAAIDRELAARASEAPGAEPSVSSSPAP